MKSVDGRKEKEGARLVVKVSAASSERVERLASAEEFMSPAYPSYPDDDDALLPDFLAKAKTFCDKFPNEVLYTNFRVIEEDRENPSAQTKTTDISVRDRIIEDVYVKNFIHNHTCLYPAISLKNREQDSHLSSLDDWEFLLNVLSGSNFRHIDINGPVIYKDYVNTGNRRGTSDGAQGSLAIADYLYIYRRWPAPNQQLKQQRKELLKSVGLDVPIEWV
jgi:hypothetical protein